MVQAIKRDEVYIEPEGIYVETHQPERRSRKPPLLLVHGALTGSWMWSPFAAYFAERGWEAHAMNLRGHYTSDLADLATTEMGDYAAADHLTGVVLLCAARASAWTGGTKWCR